MNEIERYIQFAVDNGLNLGKWHLSDGFDYDYGVIMGVFIYNEGDYSPYISLEKLITSKLFISAVSRGIFDNNKILERFSENYYFKVEASLKLEENLNFMQNSVSSWQAKSIMNGELNEFITDILGK